MIRIRISYSSDQELKELKCLLCPLIGADNMKVAKQQTGRYKRAYLDIDTEKILGCLSDVELV